MKKFNSLRCYLFGHPQATELEAYTGRYCSRCENKVDVGLVPVLIWVLLLPIGCFCLIVLTIKDSVWGLMTLSKTNK